MNVIGVTGRMASGKTRLCRQLVEAGEIRGIPVTHVEVDALRSELLASDDAVIARCAEAFGRHVLSPRGGVDRRKLSEIAFKDDEALARHDAILLPRLRDKIGSLIGNARAGLVLVDWALLVEQGFSDLVGNRFLAVTCPEEIRRRRLDGGDLPAAQIEARLSRQLGHVDLLRTIRAAEGSVFTHRSLHEPGPALLSTYLDKILSQERTPAPAASSCLFRIPETGKRALWQLTNRCNYRCSYCVFASNAAKVPGELPTEAVFAALDGLREAGFTHLKFTGGEPFTRPDLMDILERACALGFFADLSTNATFIDDDTASRLAAMGLERVHVSLDGPDAAAHEAVRGPNTFAPTVAGIRRLVERNVEVRAGCVIHRGNETKLAGTIALCEELGVAELAFSYMEPAGRVRAGDPSLPGRDDARVLAQITGRHALKVSRNFARPPAAGAARCPGAENFLYIDHLGRLSPCTWVTDKRPGFRTARSLRDAPLGDLLRDPELAAYRDWLKARPPGCPVVNGELGGFPP